MGIGASILLLAVGAILAFAVTIDPTLVAGITIEWSNVGFILMVVGMLGLIWSLVVLSSLRGRRHDSTLVEASPVERERIVGR